MNKFSHTVKEKKVIGIIVFLLVLLFNFVRVKIGLHSYSSTLESSAWKEYFTQLPVFIVVALVISYLVVYFSQYIFTKKVAYMCKSCLEPSLIYDKQNITCEKCNGLLEPLEGFYDRHPDLRNNSE